MLRLVQVPTAYYQHPMDCAFGTPWYYGPRSVRCCTPSICSPRMVYPTLATFLQEAMDLDCDDSIAYNTSCNCQQTHQTQANKKDQQSEEISPDADKTSASQKDDCSKEETADEVSIPLNTSSHTDSNKFQVSLNLSSFNPENIEVKRIDNKLKISATQEVKRCGMVFHREIQRSFNLPDNIDSDSLKSTLSTSRVLTVEAERKDSSACIDQKAEHKEEYDIDGSVDERPTTEDPQENHAVEGGDGIEIEQSEKAANENLEEIEEHD